MARSDTNKRFGSFGRWNELLPCMRLSSCLPVPDPDRMLTAQHLLPHLQRCGYGPENLLSDVQLSGGRKAQLAGFAQRPFDTRSACLSAMDVVTNPDEDAKACRQIGAPVTLLCHQGYLLWWAQTGGIPFQIGPAVPAKDLAGFFREHREGFAPKAIYRAKTIGRFQQASQLSFVDLGLMPLLEQEIGQAIERLLLACVAETRDTLGWTKEISLDQGRWLVKSVFWLLGAKMLHDKGVENFVRLDFGDVDEVFGRLAKHYGESADGLVTSQAKRRALITAAAKIDRSSSLQLATTESLAYVYENTLISKEVRKEFGTHSTPGYLVDYILGRLAPWIEDMDQDKRSVFEPACGHAAFLVAAIRQLTSLLPPDMAEPAARKKFLRDRVCGYDVDDFAIEIAKLSLTLADIPNPNGWMVKPADLFASDLLERAAKKSSILLANPPFEDFSSAQRESYTQAFRRPQFLNKTTEVLHRTLSVMPEGGLFGVVVPQSLLHESNSAAFRKLLIKQFEFQELCLFPDRVFTFADQETAVIIGRKHPLASPNFHGIRYRRVREGQKEIFKKSYGVTSELEVPAARFQQAKSFDLRVPDLEAIWQWCRDLDRLSDYVDVGQGFSFVGEDRPEFPVGAKTASDHWFEGAVEGFENLGNGVQTHQTPRLRWLNLSDEVMRRKMSGTKTGVPQILLNEAPVQRAPWCLRAMIDHIGRPAKSCFTVLRPTTQSVSLEAIWAIINNPFANAFAYAHSSKWHILTGTVRDIPVPELSSFKTQRLVGVVRKYMEAVVRFEAPLPLRSDETRAQETESLRRLHWRVEAEVLRLYALPEELEWQLLKYFSDWERGSVPFKQASYLPESFDLPIGLADLLAITDDWELTNKRRLKLIEKKREKTIRFEEMDELKDLQRLAGLKRELLSSPTMNQLGEMEADLRRRGLWRGA